MVTNFRLISTRGMNVNDVINTRLCSLSYCGVEDAAREVARQGCNTVLVKVDVKRAYRVLPVHPEDRWLLGMHWEGALYVDITLSFGLRSSPNLFTALVEWILKQAGIRFVIHYLDDVLAPGSTECDECEDSAAGV